MKITVLPSAQHYLSVHEMVNSYATTSSSSSNLITKNIVSALVVI
jgi:hypothetical protein